MIRYRKICVLGVDPLMCVTLPQACLEVYCRNFMPEKSIEIFKTKNDKYSHIALKSLKKVENERIFIQHTHNSGEKKIVLYFVDCLYKNEIFSFHCCFYHGCPDLQAVGHYTFQIWTNPWRKLSTDSKQETIFRNLGYKVNEMW